MNISLLYFRRQGITLIELLIVISIIAVLAAMLLPTITMVRSSSRTVVCQSSLRQLGIASIAWAGDNDDKWPVSEWADTPRFWGMRISAYFENAAKPLKVGERPSVPFACPESKLVLQDAESGGDFAKNMFAGGYSAWSWTLQCNLSQYNSSETIAYGENSAGRTSVDSGAREFGSWVGQSPATWGMGFWRHRGKANLVYLDGHCASTRQEQIQFSDFRLLPWGWPK